MKVLLAGGGTGGHINPALAIASIIKQHDPGAEFLFAGTPNGMEAKLIPQAGYPIEFINVAGFQRKLTLKTSNATPRRCGIWQPPASVQRRLSPASVRTLPSAPVDMCPAR